MAIMTCKTPKAICCAALAISLGLALRATAQEADAAAQSDAELKGEIAYVEALVDSGFPDFAESVIEATKKKWPESEAAFFAIEVRGLLMLNKFDEAEKKIAALPDRKGSKYWAARLEVANNYFRRGKKKECEAIYSEFFKDNAKPAKGLVTFYRQALFQWGQLQLENKDLKAAAETYLKLAGMLDKNNDDDDSIWLNVTTEAIEIYLRLAAEAKPKDRGPFLAAAKKPLHDLLWRHDSPVYFGRAIAMRAHFELLKGSVAKAQQVIDDYIDQLADIHASIVKVDPDGRLGLLRQSAMPQCRYLLAEMLWKEALEESKKPKRDDERIKSLMFGERGKNGKRSGGGAYNHAITVFVKYPHSAWASKAGDLAKEIAAFAKTTYNANIRTNISAADEAKVRALQFLAAYNKYIESDWQGAIDEYLKVLAGYPEGNESVAAVENIASSYLNMIFRAKGGDKATREKKESWRIDADAVEGYLAERFSGSKDRLVMTSAGDAILRLAALERSYGDVARSEALQKAFLLYYTNHVNAATMAISLAEKARGEKRYRDAISLYEVMEKHHSGSPFYATAMYNLSLCYQSLDDIKSAIVAQKKFVDAEKDNPIRKLQGSMSLALLYQKDGLAILNSAETNATPEAVDAQLKKGTAQIIRGVKEFRNFAEAIAAKLADPGVTAKDKESYQKMRETALYMIGCSWGMMTKPEDKLPLFRANAVKGLEEYVGQYPQGKYAKSAYVRLGTMYTVLNDIEKSKSALGRLKKEFPDSDEAKKSAPRLARSILEYAKTLSDEAQREKLRKEATDIYSEMLRSTGSDYQAIDFARAGEILIEAKNWSLADEAFDRAIQKAGTNFQSTVARCYIGKANSLFAQKNYIEARDALDKFMDNKNLTRYPVTTNACDLLIKVAMIQGHDEKDDKLRGMHYGAAIGAIKKLRSYLKKDSPVWEADRLDLMSADVKRSQMDAEFEMGLDEAAAKTRGTLAATLQAFVQARMPSGAHTIDKFSAEEIDNLEGAFARMVPLLVKMGPTQASRALKYGSDYMKLFPNGVSKDTIQRSINEAEAQGAKMPEEDEMEEPAAQKPENAGEQAAPAAPAAPATPPAPAPEASEE